MERYVAGADVGGTTIKLGIFTDKGELKKKWEIPTRCEDHGEHILPDIAASLEKEAAAMGISKQDIAGCGMGVPGPVDSEGVVRKAVNLGWDYFDLEKKAGEILGIRTWGANDANAAALGEAWKGAAAGCRSIVMVTLGTGIGGGIIIDGKILTGVTGAGGEIGHIHVSDDEERTCGCGNRGCLEQYASATGIAYLAKKYLERHDDDSVMCSAEVIDAKVVLDAAAAGDGPAIAVCETFGKYLGSALAGIACVINPDVIVIGGGVSRAGDRLLGYIEKNFREHVFHASRGARFVIATLGNDAGIYGCAKLAIDGI